MDYLEINWMSFGKSGLCLVEGIVCMMSKNLVVTDTLASKERASHGTMESVSRLIIDH